ncbi:hypothetical protein V1514DRAFT_354448 [Lipomyces japonicus]|uniref:uncharacterized protein n=1 Tax=Lipomyces japonicus TaxID=56871 RepID=UPI0034CEDD6E
MSGARYIFNRILPPALAVIAGVYTGFQFFDPILREERERLINEHQIERDPKIDGPELLPAASASTAIIATQPTLTSPVREQAISSTDQSKPS